MNPREYFSIVSMGRSGSTFLEHLINSHPKITCLGEALSPDSDYGIQSNRDISEYLESTLFAGISGVAGFKMPWDFFMHYPDAWGALRSLRFKIIFLVRVNKLDQFISVKLAQENNLWASDGKYSEQVLDIDSEELRRFFYNAAYADTLMFMKCCRFSHICVTYERLLKGVGIEEIQRFLGVTPIELAPVTTRSRSVPRQEVVRNFEALRQEFTGSPWQKFFTQEDAGLDSPLHPVSVPTSHPS